MVCPPPPIPSLTATLSRERRTLTQVRRRLFKSFTFLVIFLAGAVGTFPLFVPPFFLLLYSKSIGLSSSTGAGLLAGFNFSSAVGRICCGVLCDSLGALNVLFVSMALSAVSMLAIWPASTTLGAMVAFVVVNGVSNGGFFSTMPTVVGNVFGSARVSVAMGMIVTGWAGGYLMVRLFSFFFFLSSSPDGTREEEVIEADGDSMTQGAPIAGYFLEAYGGAGNGLQAYRPAMFYAGSLSLASAGLVALVRFRMNKSIMAKL